MLSRGVLLQSRLSQVAIKQMLFRNLKNHIRGIMFLDNEHLKYTMNEHFYSQTNSFFYSGIAALVDKWSKWIHV
jgi:hypothetical protein